MGIALVVLGLFLWFSLAFNGGVGELFVNYSFFASALFLVIAGLLKINRVKWEFARNFCAIALVAYLPMIWQRFNFTYGTDWVGFYFDVAIVIFMLIFISSKPNKSLKSGTPESGAP